jgi:8-oxo-dGTP pyrophosphatase MutT (NUDIX family)
MDFMMMNELQVAIASYHAKFPAERDIAELFRGLGDRSQNICSRQNINGHVTGSAYVVDPGMRSILLVYHLGLLRWLQPGGHLDEGELPWDAAAREAVEETGIGGLQALPWHSQNKNAPIDFEVNNIPANVKRNEPAHFHYDFRYVFLGRQNQQLTLQESEVANARWYGFTEAQKFLGKRPMDKLCALFPETA